MISTECKATTCTPTTRICSPTSCHTRSFEQSLSPTSRTASVKATATASVQREYVTSSKAADSRTCSPFGLSASAPSNRVRSPTLKITSSHARDQGNQPPRVCVCVCCVCVLFRKVAVWPAFQMQQAYYGKLLRGDRRSQGCLKQPASGTYPSCRLPC